MSHATRGEPAFGNQTAQHFKEIKHLLHHTTFCHTIPVLKLIKKVVFTTLDRKMSNTGDLGIGYVRYVKTSCERIVHSSLTLYRFCLGP
jgi:hypothetical protein